MATRTYYIRYQTAREYFFLVTDARHRAGSTFNQFEDKYVTTILAKLFYPIGGIFYENTTAAVNGYEQKGDFVYSGSVSPPAYFFFDGSDTSLNLELSFEGPYSIASWDKIGWGTDYATFTNNVMAWCQNNVPRISELSYSNDINVVIWWDDLDMVTQPGNNLCCAMIYVGNDTSADETRSLADTSVVVNITDLTPWS